MGLISRVSSRTYRRNTPAQVPASRRPFTPTMGKVLKKKPQAISKSASSSNPDRPLSKAKVVGGHARSKSTAKLVNLRDRGGKPIRNKSGKIVKQAEYQTTLASGTRARVQPDRRWFGNTRVIGQKQLQEFEAAGKKAINDPYKMILRQTKLPISLIKDKITTERSHLVDSHQTIFG